MSPSISYTHATFVDKASGKRASKERAMAREVVRSNARVATGDVCRVNGLEAGETLSAQAERGHWRGKWRGIEWATPSRIIAEGKSHGPSPLGLCPTNADDSLEPISRGLP
ncbi:hypothetical protein CRG98_029043 [Punica granatum]|uniref:Uncharacterized protein n=1 Tax=Punica granatum TaxID=22663 RepID=A0A2I0J3P9_PUNGR|nr:hypothetical protein CRG98_029043 [Punica granatum]